MEQPASTKSCPCCGTRFECRPGACWCGSITLAPEVLARLRMKYRDCLCPECLRGQVEAAHDPTAEPGGPG